MAHLHLRFLLWFGPALWVLGSAAPALPHGGSYRGPATAGAGGGAGGLGPLGPTGASNAPGVLAGGAMGATSLGSEVQHFDLTRWDLWWQHNQAPYLALKERVQSSGGATGQDAWFLGDGQKAQKGTLRPGDDQIRGEIVPALLAVLEHETNDDLVTGALVALAKIGDGGPDRSAAEGARMLAAIARFLKDGSQEIRETAAVSLGILASPRSIPMLSHLLWNTEEGRKLVGKTEVDYRTRSFAAYGLGLVGARVESEIDRQLIVSILRRALERDDTSTRDLEVGCLISLGLVPLATFAAPLPAAGTRRALAESSRQAQLDFLLAILRDEKREFLARAQCPISLARLLRGLPEPHLAHYRAEIAGELLERVERERDPAEVVQSCVLALGQIGTNDGKDPLDARIRRALFHVPEQVSEPQARAFALIGAAEIGARSGRDQTSQGIDDACAFLVDQLLNGKNFLRPWAALAGGILCRQLQDQGVTHAAIVTLQRVLRASLVEERAHERLGAQALAAGLARSLESAPHLLRLLDKGLPDDARGNVAVGLAFLEQRVAVEPLRAILARSKYRPELLRQGAIALGILGDKDVGTQLAGMLADARSLASQVAIASALGPIGDRRSVEPLLALLASRLATEKARAFAAVALGNVADKELLPWNSKIGLGLNYRAAPATLSDPLGSLGILDIL